MFAVVVDGGTGGRGGDVDAAVVLGGRGRKGGAGVMILMLLGPTGEADVGDAAVMAVGR